MTAKEVSTRPDTMPHPERIAGSASPRADHAAACDQGNRRARRDPKIRYFPESQFGGYSDIDQLVVFYTRVRSLLEPSFTVLDIGCGRGRHAENRTARTD